MIEVLEHDIVSDVISVPLNLTKKNQSCLINSRLFGSHTSLFLSIFGTETQKSKKNVKVLLNGEIHEFVGANVKNAYLSINDNFPTLSGSSHFEPKKRLIYQQPKTVTQV